MSVRSVCGDCGVLLWDERRESRGRRIPINIYEVGAEKSEEE